ncbi:MAG: carbohydrate ABC transporter permease [Bacillaceae bacterium]|nr:carbohydrate ABC transporter permease [Bacillaceae bacterium]
MLKKKRGKMIVNTVLAFICFIWFIPSVGLLISSFKSADDISNIPWWHSLPHRAYVTEEIITLPEDTPLREPMDVNGITITDEDLRRGVELEDGSLLKWESRNGRQIAVQEKKWTMHTDYTLENYRQVISGRSVEITDAEGNTRSVRGSGLSEAFINTLVVAVPGTLIPLILATFTAYGLAWTKFYGKKVVFGIIVILLVFPSQVALVPIYRDFMKIGIAGTYLSVWMAHAAFGLPLLTFFMYNYIRQLPRSIFESTFIDGATHFKIFMKLVAPLSVPAVLSIGIFQFNWVWNDYLINLIFLGGMGGNEVLSMRLASMIGQRGENWHLLTSGAIISMILPLTIFFLMQKFFVRGLLGGSVKG